MINLPSNFKRVWIVAMIVFSAVCSANLHAQELDITTKKDSIKENGSVFYSLYIDIIKGEAPFSAYLYDKAPWMDGKVIDKKENVYVKTILFSKIPSGKYCLVISSRNNAEVINRTIKL